MSQEMKEMNNQVEELNSTELNEEDLEAASGGLLGNLVSYPQVTNLVNAVKTGDTTTIKNTVSSTVNKALDIIF